MTALGGDRDDVWEIADPDTLVLVLVGCSAGKLAHAAPARDFYTGDLFRASVAWAESWGLRWAVLSALHGIVGPDETVSYYDVKLPPESDADNVRWLADDLSGWNPPAIVVLAGSSYVEWVRTAVRDRVQVWAPLQELDDRGLGYYKRWLRQNTNRAAS